MTQLKALDSVTIEPVEEVILLPELNAASSNN